MAGPRTLYDKIWDDHLVHEADDGTCLLYIDRHLVHEVTSPQAFEGLRMTGRSVRAPEKTLAVVDHNVPTTDRVPKGIAEEESRIQVETLARNAAEFGVQYFSETDARQGIVHIIGPEQGFTLPGTTIVCGDGRTFNPWGFRRSGPRHRHFGSGTRSGNPDTDPEKGPQHESAGRWQAGQGCDGKRHHSVGHRRNRYGRRHRPRHRVCRTSIPAICPWKAA